MLLNGQVSQGIQLHVGTSVAGIYITTYTIVH